MPMRIASRVSRELLMRLVIIIASTALVLAFDVSDPASSFVASFNPASDTAGTLSLFLSKSESSSPPAVFDSAGAHEFTSASIAFTDADLFAGPADCDFAFSNEVDGTTWPLSASNWLTTPATTLTSIPTIRVTAGQISSLLITCRGFPLPDTPLDAVPFTVSLSTDENFIMDITPSSAALTYTPAPAPAPAHEPSVFAFSYTRDPFAPFGDDSVASGVASVRGSTTAALADVSVASIASSSAYNIAIRTTSAAPLLATFLAGLTSTSAPQSLLPSFTDIANAAAAAAATAEGIPAPPAATVTLVGNSVYQGEPGSFLCADASAASGYAACAVPGGCGTTFQGAITCAAPSTAVPVPAAACAFTTRPNPSAGTAGTAGCAPQISAISVAISPAVSAEGEGAGDGNVLTVSFTPVAPAKFHPSDNIFVIIRDPSGTLSLDGAACAAAPAPPAGSVCTGAAGELRVLVSGAAVRAGAKSVAVEGVEVTQWVRSLVLGVGAEKEIDAGYEDVFTGASDDVTVSNVGIVDVNVDGTAVFLPPTSADDSSNADDEGLLLITFTPPESNPSLTLTPEAVSSFISVLPQGWSISTCASVASASSGTGPSTTGIWPPTVRAADPHAAVPAGAAGNAFAAPVDFAPAENRRAYVLCHVDSYVAENMGGISVGFGTNSTLYASKYISTIVPISASGDMYLGFSLAPASGSAPIDASALAVLADSDAAAVAPAETDGGPVTVLLRFDGANQVFLSAALSLPAINALIAAADGKEGLQGFAGIVDEDSFSMGLTGEWQCGSAAGASSYAPCTIANSCGTEFSHPFVCVSGSAVMPLFHACLFQPRPVPVPVSTGCGTLLCADPSGAFVPCDHESVCMPGCDSSPVPITPDNEDDPALAVHCVLNGVKRDTAAFCPPTLVSPAPFAETCVRKSECALHCTDQDTGIVMPCTSDETWGSCSKLCGNGTRTRTPVCAVNTDEGEIPTALDADMCRFAAAVGEVKEECTGTECEVHVWMCAPTGSSNSSSFSGLSFSASSADTDSIPCSDPESWGPCSVPCGFGVRTRTLSCAFVDGDGKVITADADEALCVAQSGPAPEESEVCGRASCPEAKWGCIESGATAPAPCANSTDWYSCPTSGCSELNIARDVACYVDNLGFAVANGNCTAEEPEGSHQCALVTDKCEISFETAECVLHANRTVDPLASGYCLRSGLTSPLFRLGDCVDTEGEVVDPEWCKDAGELFEECPLKPCDGVSFEWLVKKGECINREFSCQTYKLNKVTCAALTHSEVRLPVNDTFCKGQEKPSVVERCPRASCRNGGTCEASVVIHDEIEYPNVFSGECVCPIAIGGPLCGVVLAVSDAKVSVKGDKYVFDWSVNDITVSSTLTLSLNVPKSPIPAIIGAVDAVDRTFSVPVSDINALVRPGDYTVTLRYGTKSVTVPLKHVPLCSLPSHGCGTFGTCESSTGVCACQGEWSGPTCSVSPCDVLGCNPNGATCDDSTGVAVCECATDGDGVPLLTGPRCYTPVAECEDVLICQGNGVRAVAVIGNNTECGTCECVGNYGGNDCGTCMLETKCGHGSPSSSCDSCMCKAGYHGSACVDRHVVVIMVFSSTALPWYKTSPPGSSTIATWVSGLEKSLNNIVRATGVTVAVLAHERRTSVNLLMPSYVQVTFAVSMIRDDSMSVSAVMASRSEYQGLDILKKAFESGRLANEPAFTGLITGAGLGISDPNCVGNDCPRNIGDGGVIQDDEDPDDAKKKGSSSTTIIVVVVVVVVVVLLLIVIIVLAKKKRVLCFKPSHRDYAGNGNIQLGNTNYSV